MEKMNELLARRVDLVERIESIEPDYRRGLNTLFAERMLQLKNTEALERIASAAEELELIESKLALFA